jgi:trehalose/maltose transport system substrate-binding protein
MRSTKKLWPWLAVLLFSSVGATSAENIELRLVGWKPEAPQVWDQAVVDFERQNPGVKIIREVAPNSSTQFHDLLTQKLKNRDTKLDVFFMDVVWPAEFASAGWALPLNRYFPASEQAKFLQAPITANGYYGQIFGVPLFIDAGLLYYRKDLLEKYALAPPHTWPQLVETATTVLARERDPDLVGFSGQFKQYEGLVCNMMEYILANGGSLWDEKRLVSTLDQPRALEAVRFVRDRVVGQIAHRGVLTYEEPESLALFIQGRAIFHRNWPYAWKFANDPATSKVAGRIGMMPLPAFPGNQGVATLGGWQLGVSRLSRRPDLAWRFVAFMTSAEMQKRVALATGRAPTRSALYNDQELLTAIPQHKSLLQTFRQAVPRPTTPVYIPLSNIMQRYFSSALTLPDADLAARAALAARDMNRVLELLRERAAP